jgi:DNA-binding transcriptional LysR family regulator
MQLRHLRYFIGIMDAGTFRVASTQLNISQSALSRRIAELEVELGFALFSRSRHGAQPTIAGREYAAHVRSALDLLAVAQERASTLAQGSREELRFASVRSATRFACIDKALNSFARGHSDVALHLERLTAIEIADGLKKGQLDAGITYRELLADRNEAYIPLHVEQVMLAMPSAHPLANRPHLGLAELEHINFVWSARRSSPAFYDALMHACQESGFRPQISAVIDSTDSLMLVRAGVGCSFVSSSTEARADCKQIVLKPVVDLSFPLTLIFTWNSRSDPANQLAIFFRRFFAAHQRLLARHGPRWASLPHQPDQTSEWAPNSVQASWA